ncbi:hypothetical protein [Haladaptatus salinisoli]|uniref:hypothetical protein n=1 Tax=Haladaptatus salinisoli TaxID=2884876 RepID=UPI001D0AC2BA|nr:hypothetical protein [Haladaptatus salinisoli]
MRTLGRRWGSFESGKGVPTESSPEERAVRVRIGIDRVRTVRGCRVAILVSNRPHGFRCFSTGSNLGRWNQGGGIQGAEFE